VAPPLAAAGGTSSSSSTLKSRGSARDGCRRWRDMVGRPSLVVLVVANLDGGTCCNELDLPNSQDAVAM